MNFTREDALWELKGDELRKLQYIAWKRKVAIGDVLDEVCYYAKCLSRGKSRQDAAGLVKSRASAGY